MRRFLVQYSSLSRQCPHSSNFDRLPEKAQDGRGEKDRLYEVSKSLGFMYLDMLGCKAGESLLGDADNMFSLMEQFFDRPMEE